MPFDHFDLIAGSYNRLPPFEPGAELENALALPIRGLLLDAGGGTGRVAAALQARTGGVIVVDVSRGMLRRAAQKGLATLLAPAEALPLAASSFERVIMVDAWHHLTDQEATARELWRLLVPGGRIVILEPDIHRFGVKLIALGERLLLMRSHFMSADRIASIFSYPDARVRVVVDGTSVIVSVERVREMQFPSHRLGATISINRLETGGIDGR
jgi:SAM-dependent methyltransferase